VNYLLDTNVCIAPLNNNRDTVRKHFEDAVDAGSTIYVSTIAGFELWYGVE
jgi:predicted nucleic acid-binding protein